MVTTAAVITYIATGAARPAASPADTHSSNIFISNTMSHQLINFVTGVLPVKLHKCQVHTDTDGPVWDEKPVLTATRGQPLSSGECLS